MVDSFLEITTERGSQKFCKRINVNSVTNAIDDIQVSMIFLIVTFVLWIGSKQIEKK